MITVRWTGLMGQAAGCPDLQGLAGRPAGAGCQAATGRVFARLAGTRARPFRLRLPHMNFAEVTSPSPGSIRHGKACVC